ncbi:MAG TPA: hypothetical protein DGG94_23175 [Micromonosporaceae bacterium]|nr:hypothetical protein [Micromonosporaceae bacterium]HCU52654.1 hypothetical protein [Micromonosporaceae bacterium]
MLTECGLATALAELRRRAKAPVTLDVDVTSRFAEDVETTAYFVVIEALQNATRHAPGAQIHVHVTFSADELVVSVRDNGHGGR